MEKATADPLVGRTVAQYEIVTKLGGGGMGVVYKARDSKLGRVVALKFLPPQWSHDESAKQRFIREAQAASATDHGNICTIHDIQSTDDGQLFIVMAYYDGETLKERLERGPLSIDDALDIATQVADGLAKAHAQGVVHRDIKPGNLIVTEDAVKIVDFGLAKFANSLHLTVMGSTIGTIAYMSPEQARGEEADARSDVWSAGVVLYEMLAGQLPFRGGYAEAISHAIRNEAPASLKRIRPEVSDEVEQLVFRALHKDPRIRFQSGRDLARALRRVRGQTMPLDLRTEPLPPIEHQATIPQRRPTRRKWSAAGAALAVVFASASLWVFWPIAPIPIVVAPVVNQTGYAELDPYRLALTYTLQSELRDLDGVRVLPFDRLLQFVRRFGDERRDISSRDAMQAIASNSNARVILVPTLLYESGMWKARVAFRNAGTSVDEGVYETPAAPSALMKDVVYVLMTQLATGIQAHFDSNARTNVMVANALRRFVGRAPPSPAPPFRTLDAAAAFVQGIEAYEHLEYPLALQAFVSASERDARSPLVFAWRSRVAQLMRRDNEAREAAEQALRLLTDSPSSPDRLFIEAVAAEGSGDLSTAERRYEEHVRRYRDEPGWIVELAAFHDRRGRTEDAIATYHQALERDERLLRARVELCRLYNRGAKESANARQQAQTALAGYRALGDRSGEIQALFCLVDALRLGDTDQRREARRHADVALTLVQRATYPYNLARAYNYEALAASAQGNLAEAIAFWDKSLVSAKDSGNIVLAPLVLMNLGATHVALGQRTKGVQYYRESAKGFEALGDQSRAAEIQANLGAVTMKYGANPADGERELQNALSVLRKRGNRNFEAFGTQLIADSHRRAGRHAEAERQLNRGIALSREHNLDAEIATSLMGRARSRFDTNDYVSALDLLTRAIPDAPELDRNDGYILLGLTYARMGDFTTARSTLEQASREIEDQHHTVLRPSLNLALGKLAYDTGRLQDARTYFGRAALLWTDEFPDPASVEATAYVGLLDALSGDRDAGVAAIRRSLEQANAMQHLEMRVRCLVFLARLAVGARQWSAALQHLDAIPNDDESRTIGRELRAQAHYWRSQALAGMGDTQRASAEIGAARSIVATLRDSLPESVRAGFDARADIQAFMR